MTTQICKCLRQSFLIAALLFTGAATTFGQQRIADAWFAHNAVVVMLGGADQIAVTVATPTRFPWMYRVAPDLYKAESIDGTTLNAEELHRLHIDLVFTSKTDPTIPVLQHSGFHVVPVGFEDFSSLAQSVEQTANVLGTPLALQRSKAYREYLEKTLTEIRSATAKVPEERRPRVLHILSLDPLRVDGEGTIIDEWIKTAGGRNAAVGLKGVKREVSIEQVLAWQPDVLILAADAGSIETSQQKSLLESLTAVQQHRVFRNPAGVFPWDRYGPELALELQWAATILEPQVLHPHSLAVETQKFYKEFFSYNLTKQDAEQMLQGTARK